MVFGPRPRDFRQRTPKKMRRLSLVTVLSDKVREDELVVLETLTLDRPKTREVTRILDALDAGPKPLLVADGVDASVLRSARNTPGLKMLPASLLNTLDLLKHRKVIMTLDAVRAAEEMWGAPLNGRRKQAASPVAQA